MKGVKAPLFPVYQSLKTQIQRAICISRNILRNINHALALQKISKSHLVGQEVSKHLKNRTNYEHVCIRASASSSHVYLDVRRGAKKDFITFPLRTKIAFRRTEPSKKKTDQGMRQHKRIMLLISHSVHKSPVHECFIAEQLKTMSATGFVCSLMMMLSS